MTKKAIAEFEPSKGDETYLAVKDLPPEWGKVKAAWIESRRHAAVAVGIFMDMGDLLIELRKTYKGDLEFGKARKQFVPELSRNDAHRAMGMANNRERFTLPADKPNPSISVFAELVNASDDLVAEVVEATADPKTKTPTVKEVREKVKAEKPETAEDFEESIQGGDKPKPVADVEPSETEVDFVNDVLLLDTVDRIKALRKKYGKKGMDTHRALLVLGINPLFDGEIPMNERLFRTVGAAFADGDDNTIVADALALIEESFYD